MTDREKALAALVEETARGFLRGLDVSAPGSTLERDLVLSTLKSFAGKVAALPAGSDAPPPPADRAKNPLADYNIKWVDVDGSEHVWPCESHRNIAVGPYGQPAQTFTSGSDNRVVSSDAPPALVEDPSDRERAERFMRTRGFPYQRDVQDLAAEFAVVRALERRTILASREHKP